MSNVKNLICFCRVACTKIVCTEKINVNAEGTNMSTHKREHDLYVSEQDRISVSMGFGAILQPKIPSLQCSNV